MFIYVCVLSCSALCELIDCNPLGSSVHENFQARILEWVAIPYSRDLPNPGIEPITPMRLQHWQVDSLPLINNQTQLRD